MEHPWLGAVFYLYIRAARSEPQGRGLASVALLAGSPEARFVKQGAGPVEPLPQVIRATFTFSALFPRNGKL